MVMGHSVNDELLKMVQLTLEDTREEFAAVSEAVTSLQDQQQSLEDQVEEQKQRLDEMSAQHSEQGENFNRILEMMESLKTQLGQGRYAVSVSPVKLFTLLSLPVRERERVISSLNNFTLKKGSMSFSVSPNSLGFVPHFVGVVLTFTYGH